MPELPEVELVTRFLRTLILGRKIVRAELFRERLAPHTTPATFETAFSGSTIDLVDRRGKHILFGLDNDRTLVTHLRMSGRFMLLNGDNEDPRFAHAVFHFQDGARLVFQDQRHFGFMRLATTADLAGLPEIRKLAPEPFSDEFSIGYLFSTLRASDRAIKDFLLDQSRVCGLGNIYAAEALFLAKLHPSKRTNTMTGPRTARLHEAIRAILTDAINAGSTLNTDPADSDTAYYGGEYERYWQVYGREGLACVDCGTTIKRSKQAGRSTFFCPKCQKR
jgi:formamidopyrimidine-DNA glycosylase